jgi:tetratricopeptide (TPR) repeat protein
MNMRIFSYYFVLLCLIKLIMPTAYAAESGRWVGGTLTGEPCTGGYMAYGPFDYTNSMHHKLKLDIVEEYHFTKDIELLIKGKTGYLTEDLNYTLTAFPNHHKALNAIMYYQIINKIDIDKGTKKPLNSPVECYFQRAINFAPHDIVAYALYADYLKRTKHISEAEQVYQKAMIKMPDDLALKYHYGLFLCAVKKFPEALAQAKIVYKANYPKSNLKKMLKNTGQWKD